MELKNEERSSIFAAYWGAKIKHEHFDKTFTLYKIELRDWFAVDLLDEELVIYRSRLISDCQLLLSPLSAISKAHIAEILKMDYGYKKDEVTEIIKIQAYGNYGITVAYKFENGSTKGEGTRYFNEFNTKQTDQLREWGYNVGYGKYSPADLVSMGLVIETKTENIYPPPAT